MANELIFSPGSTNDAFFQYQGDGGAEGTGIFVVGYEQVYTNMTVRGALRFTGVNIAQGASISSADIQIYAGLRQGSASVNAKVWGINEDNTGDFSGGGGVFARSRTTDSNTNSYTGGQGSYFTIGVASMVQQIVNRGGWSSGNAMGFVVEDNGTTHDAPGNYVEDSLSFTPHSFLSIRVGAEPNFTPTPTTVAAPSLPTPGSYGIKISEVGQDVLTATDEQSYFTTRKKMFKVSAEAYYQSVAADVTAGYKAIAHNLGYIPFASVFVKSSVFGGSWKKLPINRNYSFEDHPSYYIDSTNLYLHSAAAGEEFYYYIFLDQLST